MIIPIGPMNIVCGRVSVSATNQITDTKTKHKGMGTVDLNNF
jgi:uncharacterized protein YunC (DUF1805 family)